ncbi:nicotinate phosphoribosyltransferase [Parabacteroides sp. FAFU027]|uniref:nicotinate phosphoribosyltransferase n=1 Tax=Parabacteroides sp. FAFU027 TaxID=2922715 RepID=UPI001FAF2642|nr:nicotinate phosphoribosyltransferase [Parabacteroides sp. FAFU027]
MSTSSENREFLHFTGTYTDLYQLTMAQAYFMQGRCKDHRAVFDYFFRKLPFNGGYAVFAGLESLLEALENLQFDRYDLEYLKAQGFDSGFLHYLDQFRFRGNVFSSLEGDLIFPVRPILSIEANIIEAQIVETLLLNILNFQTLIATKARRMRSVAGNRVLIDFGLRRAHGPGGYYAARAAIVGGFNGTSNVLAGRDFDVPISGTMAHSFVESYDEEISAFRDFAQTFPENSVMLVDTYNTLESGVPNAIIVGKEMEKSGHRLKGIRLDSGDLAYLAKQTRKMLDDAGLHYVKIVVSDVLDEHVIKSLLEQGAPIDVFGVGTKLVIGHPDAALDGVYKLAYYDEQPRLKLSESLTKVTIPYKKQVYRVLDESGNFAGADVVATIEEKSEYIKIMCHPFEALMSMHIGQATKEPLLFPVMKEGKRIAEPQHLNNLAAFCQSRFNKLPDEYKRFENPHIYKIGLSQELKEKRDKLILMHQKK